MPTTKSGDSSPKHDDRGAVVVRWVRCGKAWCRCANGGPRHGPYYARYWREGGRRRKQYIRLDAVAERRGACDERRRRETESRRRSAVARGTWRASLAALRVFERFERVT